MANLIKIEVGKTYETQGGWRVKILCHVERGKYLGKVLDEEEGEIYFLYNSNGSPARLNGKVGTSPLVKEYKEPVVYKKDIVWYKYSDRCSPCCVLVSVGTPIFVGAIELKRETVEYIEN